MKSISLITSFLLFGACSDALISNSYGSNSKDTQTSSQNIDASKVNGIDLSKNAAIIPGGKSLTVEDVYKIWSSIPSTKRNPEFKDDYMRILLLMIDQERIQVAAEKEGIPKSQEFAKKKEEMTNLISQKLFMEKIAKETAEKDSGFKEKEKKAYEEEIKKHPDFDSEIFEIRHILLTDEAQAKSVYEEVSKGGIKKFEEKLAVSLDKKSVGGNIGKIRKNELPKDVVSAIGAQKNGLVAGKPVQLIPGGYSVIWMVSRETLKVPSLDSKEGKEIAWSVLKQDYVLSALENARKEADITFYDPEAKKLSNLTEKQNFSSVDFSKIDPKLIVAEFKTKEGVQKITFAEMKDMSADLLKGETLNGEVYIPILQYVADKALIETLSKQSKVIESEEAKTSINTMTKGLAQTMYLEKTLEGIKKTITEEKKKSEYEKLAKIDRTEVRIRHILVKDQATADKVASALQTKKTGDDFKKLVEQYSSDKSTKENGGDLGMVPISIFPENISKKIKAVAPGTTISEAFPIPGIGGFLFIRVEDKKIVPPPTYAEAAPKITEMLAKEQMRSKIEELPIDGVKIISLDGKERSLKEIIEENKKKMADIEAEVKKMQEKIKSKN